MSDIDWIQRAKNAEWVIYKLRELRKDLLSSRVDPNTAERILHAILDSYDSTTT